MSGSGYCLTRTMSSPHPPIFQQFHVRKGEEEEVEEEEGPPVIIEIMLESLPDISPDTRYNDH